MLLMPILFIRVGIFISIFLLIVSSIINYKTCKLYLYHMRNDETEVPQIILRILGRKWHKMYCVV